MIVLPAPSSPPAFLTSTQTFFGNVKFYQDVDRDYFLDYYVPQGTRPVGGWPCVIAIHGGSFINGDKDFINSAVYNDIFNSLLDDGIAVISIQYKLLDAVYDAIGIPKCISSAFKNILQIKSNASIFEIDKTKMAYFGVSAGGYISQLLSMKEFANKGASKGLFTESNLPVCTMSYLPNVTLDVFEQQALGLWANGVTINDLLDANATFKANCKRWFSIMGDVDTVEDLNNTKSRRIMNQISMLSRRLYLPSNKPLYLIHDKEYIKGDGSDIEKLVHPAYALEEIKTRYDSNGVECWVFGVNALAANDNPVPSTPGISMPDAWMKDKLNVT